MRVEEEQVRLFHEKYGFERADKPTLRTGAEADVRYRLMEEELNEYLRAQDNGDLVGVADALADLAYTVLGTAVAHGIDLAPIFAEVHRSNMTKDPDPGTGKPAKGPGYEPPRVAALLLMQSLEPTS